MSIAAAIAAVLIVGTAGFVAGRRTADSKAEAVSAPPASPPAPARSTQLLPPAEPPLGRADLIGIANRAGDLFAAGARVAGTTKELEAREFELSLPFACPGEAPATAGGLSATYDREAGVLRVRAQPIRWEADAWLPEQRDGRGDLHAVEDIQGFWISRPWTSSEGCPPSEAPLAGGAAAAAVEQTLGVAQFFTSEGSRVGRRDGKAYELVRKVDAARLDLTKGLQLRLKGELAPMRGGRIALCRAEGPGRPACLLGALFDEVAVVNPATGETLATWDVSAPDPRAPAR